MKSKIYIKPQEFALFMLSQGKSHCLEDLHRGVTCVSGRLGVGMNVRFRRFVSYPQFNTLGYRELIQTLKAL